MTLLLAQHDLDGRRAEIAGPLRPLADSLSSDLRRVIERPLFIPEKKALLSREGVRCPRDGTLLEFDPFSPHEHRCPRCGEAYRGELYDGFWIYWYQLWLAERAVHAALLARTGVMPDAARFAADILDGYCDRYLQYPNVDNALGPTRPFFSTYLESIWLLQLCVASRFLDRNAHARVLDRFAEQVVEPSLALISSFDEGGSNRQVWNNAAMQAANLVLDRPEAAEAMVWADSGLAHHLGTSLLEDGSWYEGENYHFFAHRGLWYGIQLAEAAGVELPDELFKRYVRGFVAPFLTSLPDLTFPSRRDSQYAISFRQWRFAEWCELGLARVEDRVLRGMLARLYAADIPRGDTGRWKSAAEAERNMAATQLDRSDLGWKSLLFARPSISLTEPAPLPSVLLPAQGIGVIRRNAGRVYVALDYGVSGGGHGHPDRLNLMVSDGERRVLDDMGTGSYVHPSLHWYRSTLAHNAPMFDGRSQRRVDGELIAYEDRGASGWMSARAAIAANAMAQRTVVVMPSYMLDEVKWRSPDGRTLDLPLHFEIEAATGEHAQPEGRDGIEDGFRFARDWKRVAEIPSTETRVIDTTRGKLSIGADVPLTIWTALVPGAPGQPDRRMALLRAESKAGTIRWMWSWDEPAIATALFPDPIIQVGAERHEHHRVEHGWQVAIHVGGSRSTIDLEGLAPKAEAGESEAAEVAGYVSSAEKPQRDFMLGAEHYRRSEQTWEEAGSPTARVTIQPTRGEVTIRVVVDGERSFVQHGAANRLDNEQADINGAGLQLYLVNFNRRAGYVIVPRLGGNSLGIRPIDGWGSAIPVEGSWKPVGDGYQVELRFKPDHRLLLLDLIVNEKPAGRERRRGQLVLSGGRGEFIYLRGDRHEPNRLIPFPIVDD